MSSATAGEDHPHSREEYRQSCRPVCESRATRSPVRSGRTRPRRRRPTETRAGCVRGTSRDGAAAAARAARASQRPDCRRGTGGESTGRPDRRSRAPRLPGRGSGLARPRSSTVPGLAPPEQNRPTRASPFRPRPRRRRAASRTSLPGTRPHCDRLTDAEQTGTRSVLGWPQAAPRPLRHPLTPLNA